MVSVCSSQGSFFSWFYPILFSQQCACNLAMSTSLATCLLHPDVSFLPNLLLKMETPFIQSQNSQLEQTFGPLMFLIINITQQFQQYLLHYIILRSSVISSKSENSPSNTCLLFWSHSYFDGTGDCFLFHLNKVQFRHSLPAWRPYHRAFIIGDLIGALHLQRCMVACQVSTTLSCSLLPGKQY